MSHHNYSLAVAFVVAVTSVCATEPSTVAPKTHPPYELKNRSVFSAPETIRPPFWPIGWVRRQQGTPTQAIVAPKVAFNEKSFIVTSILLGNPSLAVINGRSYTEGEFLRVPRGTATPRIRVQRIVDGGVQLQAEKQLFLAKLQRQELEQKKSEEPLLDDR